MKKLKIESSMTLEEYVKTLLNKKSIKNISIYTGILTKREIDHLKKNFREVKPESLGYTYFEL